MLPLIVGVVQGLILAWPVLALSLAYRLFQFPDITVEGAFLLGGAAFAVAAKSHWHPVAACGAAMLAGGLAGAATGWIHGRLKVNKFVAGILVTAASYSAALRLMGASNIGLLSYRGFFDEARILNDWLHAGSYDMASCLLLTGILALFLAALRGWFRTRPGVLMRAAAIGGTFAKNAHLPRTLWLTAGLALTNALSGLGGALISMRQGFADISMNQGIVILSLAGLSIGERLLTGRRLDSVSFVLLSALAGSVLYQVLVAYVLRAGFHSADIKFLTAALVLAMICLRRDRNLLATDE